MAEAQVVDSTIGSLPAASSLDDASLLVVEQQGAAMHITGAQIKGYAQASVSGYVGQAQEAVEEAQQASQQALEAVGQIGTSVQEAQQAAQQAQDSAESAQGIVSEAEAARDQYPKPENGTWKVYNPQSGQYEDTGEPSNGNPGQPGEPGPKGDPGASMQGLRQIGGTHAPGTTDTYEVVLTDGTTGGQFEVYNGADGSGAGDMVKSVYDPQGRNTDIFAYIDQMAGGKELFEIKAQTTDMVNVTSDVTADEVLGAYNAGKLLYARLAVGSDETVIFPLIDKIDYSTFVTLTFGVFLRGVPIVLKIRVKGTDVTFEFINEFISAEITAYDPSSSSLSADNVQSAIDELAARPSGGTTEPLSLTGFQPDPADPTGMTMTLQLTDEQYASVVSCQNDGTPIYIEGAFLVYPIGRTSESPDFSSVPTSSGSYCRLYVNYDSKLASFYPFIPLSVSAQDAGIFSSLDTPKQDASGVYEYGFNNNMPIYVYYPSLVGGEKIILYPDSHPTSTTYVFSNSTYRLTFDTSASTATLSLIDTVTEDYVTNAINTAIGNALEASY